MRLRDLSPARFIEWFVVGNLGFLGVDIFIAHQENGFREHAEWAPVAFSAVAPLLLVPGALHRGPKRVIRALDMAVGATAVVIGVLGMVFHLESRFFDELTLRSLVYSAPFIAPLAYVGVGLLLLLMRLEAPDSLVQGQWALFLAFGGFAGNLALSLLDHAENGFFRFVEWVPVAAAAFACSFLGVTLLNPGRLMVRFSLGVCALQAVVGFLGFILHAWANMQRPSQSMLARYVFGAPPFAPLLFTNLAILAALALWMISTSQERGVTNTRVIANGDGSPGDGRTAFG
jgi:hypothetical protein